MGILDFFRRRRERESAPGQSGSIEAQSQALGSFASPEGQPVVGEPVGDGFGATEFQGLPGMAEGLAALTQLGPMIQRAMAEGNVQVQQGGSQTLDLRGTGLREEILGIMQQHGIDAEAGSAQGNIDAGAYGDMQQQILAALAKHGVDLGNAGAAGIQIEQRDDDS